MYHFRDYSFFFGVFERQTRKTKEARGKRKRNQKQKQKQIREGSRCHDNAFEFPCELGITGIRTVLPSKSCVSDLPTPSFFGPLSTLGVDVVTCEYNGSCGAPILAAVADVFFFFIFATQTPLLPPDPEHGARRPSWGHETRPEFVRFGRGSECDHVEIWSRAHVVTCGQPQGSQSSR